MADNPSITPSTSSADGSTDSLDSRTRDAVADGLVELLKPAVEEIDDRVKTVRDSQVELRQQIDCLADDLKKIAEQQAVPVDLEPYVKKLNNSRRRVMLVNNILQNVQERLTKLYNNVSKETARRKTLLDSPSSGPPH
ncbi:SNARE-associated protein Snapin-like [Mizuhopecten yessoensis]|uniref:Biogenesis of lysosome-related organelles complex 1 subunit 7 n=1 Tax=Mizuhopecten yessoensis TaxID=6573 RepID=A0A210R0V8_MIZYE|nr:SNARE-associated protein Snapin-like [Mizuhopecten yessoensis]OWF54648.1 SNARE-associated protein Snapin [Mizuhopecten yessoensis]